MEKFFYNEIAERVCFENLNDNEFSKFSKFLRAKYNGIKDQSMYDIKTGYHGKMSYISVKIKDDFIKEANLCIKNLNNCNDTNISSGDSVHLVSGSSIKLSVCEIESNIAVCAYESNGIIEFCNIAVCALTKE